MYNAGELWLAQLPDGSQVPHICIVLTDEYGFLSSFYVVPVISPTPKADRTLMLDSSDCKLFKYASCVSYDDLTEKEPESFAKVAVKKYGCLTAERLQEVIDCALKSPNTPRGFKRDLLSRLNEQSK